MRRGVRKVIYYSCNDAGGFDKYHAARALLTANWRVQSDNELLAKNASYADALPKHANTID